MAKRHAAQRAKKKAKLKVAAVVHEKHLEIAADLPVPVKPEQVTWKLRGQRLLVIVRDIIIGPPLVR